MINEEAELYLDEFKSESEKCLNFLKSELNGFRAGRANPHILDKITVDYYGVPTPINQMANIAVTEARVLTISVWDASMLKNVSKAILASDIGITPNDDGKVIRLIFPTLTEERRKDLCKQVRASGENAKVTLRNARRDCLEGLKKLEKEKALSEDELSNLEKNVQKQIEELNAKVDKMVSEKESEVMSI